MQDIDQVDVRHNLAITGPSDDATASTVKPGQVIGVSPVAHGSSDCDVWHATHDPLTGLSNRNLLRVQLMNALQRAKRDKVVLALLDIGIDEFKFINETYGQGAGDAVLKTVGERISALVGKGDIVARVAGNEFSVLCERMDQAVTISMKADRITCALREPIEYDGVALSVTCSIGIAMGGGATNTVDEILRSADSARSAVKARGGNDWQIFNDELEQKYRERLRVTLGLRTAIERQELSCRFQPIVSSRNRRIVGAELLLRWHPPSGEISPAVFIPIAEATNSIIAIGKWVFRQACIKEVEWRELWGPAALQYISVNVSTRQLSDKTLGRDFANILSETGADPSRLLIEITETSMMTDVEANLQVLNELAAIGMRVAIDDFGTGYSSLAQLTRLPVSVLKIDKAFVDGVEHSAESRKVIHSIMSLGRSLGLKLVAEGVENDTQFMELRSMGCDYIQGYTCYRPLDAETFARTMIQNLAAGRGKTTEPFYFLIYVSEADPSIAAADAYEISRQSKIRNEKRGITGCLLYLDGCFMQMIEGRKEQVLDIAATIKEDERHRNVQIVLQGQEHNRVFVDWGMGFQSGSALDVLPAFEEGDNGKIRLLEIAKDARFCYFFMTAFKSAIAFDEL